MTVNSYDIREWTFEPQDVHIHYTYAYVQDRARIDTGLTLKEYEALPGDPVWKIKYGSMLSKAEVIMSYQLDKMIPSVVTDNNNRKMKRTQAMRRGRYGR